MFKDCPVYSNVNQEYLWVAEYYDGFLSEYDFENKSKNSFYDIEKENLVRFGLIGRGEKMWFECSRGVFNIFGKRIHVKYKNEEKVYELTNQNVYQRDIITYKRAFAEANVMGTQKSGTIKSNIINYNFGYKSELNIDDTLFNFQLIITVPEDINKQCYITVKVSANKDMDGELEIITGDKYARWEAPLKKNISGELSWNVPS